MVSRRTERSYDPSFTPSGQGKLFYEPASGPQQQKQDRNNTRTQAFKEKLGPILKGPDGPQGFDRVADRIVQSSTASRDDVIMDGTGQQLSEFPTTNERAESRGFTGNARDLGDGGFPTLSDDPFDRSGVDNRASLDFGWGKGAEVPGSIARLPQRATDRALQDTNRTLMPGESRGPNASHLPSQLGAPVTQFDPNRQGDHKRLRAAGYNPAIANSGRPRSPIFPAEARERAMETAEVEGHPVTSDARNQFMGKNYDEHMFERVHGAIGNVMTQRMSKAFAEKSTVEPEDLDGLGTFKMGARSDSETGSGWFRPGYDGSSEIYSRNALDPENMGTNVHEVGHNVSHQNKDGDYHDRAGVAAAVPRRALAGDLSSLTTQRPREEAFADDYAAKNLTDDGGGDADHSYRFSGPWFGSPAFRVEYEAARKVPPRDPAAEGVKGRRHLNSMKRRVGDDTSGDVAVARVTSSFPDAERMLPKQEVQAGQLGFSSKLIEDHPRAYMEGPWDRGSQPSITGMSKRDAFHKYGGKGSGADAGYY